MMDDNFEVSKIRPKQILDLLHKHTELNDLLLSEKEDDGHYIGCNFGSSRPDYEYKAGTEYGKLYGTQTYHKHDYVIRINGHNMFICREHLKFLSTLYKELPLT